MRTTAPGTLASLLLALALSASAACTFAPGDWFAELDPFLDAAFVPLADRDAGAGWQRLDTDYQALVSTASITIERIDLLDAGGASVAFDPANPPPGYSLCHNGHCHHESGRLVPYEEIEAELGGAGGPVAVLGLPVGTIDLDAGFSAPLDCVPHCGLPLSDIRVARARLERLVLEGRIRDGRASPRIAETTFRVELLLEGAGDSADPAAVLDAPIALPVDRRHDPEVDLALFLLPTVALFDGIDFAALATSGGHLDFALPGNEGARAQVRANLLETTFEGHVSRTGGTL